MRKLIAVLIGAVVGSLIGIVLGERWAREDFAQRWAVATQVFEDNRGTAERRVAFEAVAVAERLRANNVDGALEILEATIERQRAAIAEDQGTLRSTGMDAAILKSIDAYQASYPLSPPPAPSPDQTAFAEQFGVLGPRIEDGRVIGFSVRGVQPGGVFAQLGIADGDVITHWGGEAASLDRRPTLYETLQSGSRVELVLRGRDGTVRQVVLPPR